MYILFFKCEHNDKQQGIQNPLMASCGEINISVICHLSPLLSNNNILSGERVIFYMTVHTSLLETPGIFCPLNKFRIAL